MILIGAIAGCVADQANPFAGQNGLPLSWPSQDPNRYHWDGFSDPYFEGWFFRVVAADGESFAFLYGVQNPGALDAANGEAFVVAIGSGGRLVQTVFPLGDFAASRQELNVQVGGNRATYTHIAGKLRDASGEVSWSLAITPEEAWTDTMGLLTNLPFAPVNWYVGILRGRASGTIVWHGETIQLDGAPIYQDKNWGGAFPSAYVWLQASDFPDSQSAMSFVGGLVNGDAVGMFVWQRDDQLYEARSQDLNTSTQITVDPTAGRVVANLSQAQHQFELTGLFGGDTPAAPPVPTANGFRPFSLMALSGVLRVRVFDIVDGKKRLATEDWARPAAVEIGGDYRTPSAE